MSTAQSNKETAVAFLQLAISGHSAKAYSACVRHDFIHHNPHFKGDAQSLMQAMQENAENNPCAALEVQTCLQDGDRVAVHSRVIHKPGDPGIAVVHLFRFVDGLIVELWDIAQAVPAQSPNQHGMF
ncbi:MULTISPECIES: nuclear transport factor 2 family protein [Pseudomonas]|uniref:nuclear transport factor 2 family protein n=1 Tax=Pseudomonas TaxID=286 RepID=UPI001561C78B|nr:nuclear transport factor 2 family protein [Pseudomonas sp. MS19]NRH26706.1 nuclear transport factor 2 family protein [Pseudomonas sp. MS19]